MTLDFSQCKSREDVKRVFEEAQRDFEIARRLPKLLAQAGVCRVCGCTDADCSNCIAISGVPCSWADETHTICTRCAQ